MEVSSDRTHGSEPVHLFEGAPREPLPVAAVHMDPASPSKSQR